MAAKRKSKQRGLQDLFKSVGNMTYKDLKRNVVIRGMPFDKVVGGDFPNLQHWLHKNLSNEIDANLLNEYDDWLDDILVKRGKADLVHPSLRLGYIGEKSEDGEVITKKKPKGIKKPKKKKREKTKDGIYKGTKKALVYDCQKDGLSIDDTIEKVIEEFGKCSEKSVKIWYKRAAKA